MFRHHKVTNYFWETVILCHLSKGGKLQSSSYKSAVTKPLLQSPKNGKNQQKLTYFNVSTAPFCLVKCPIWESETVHFAFWYGSFQKTEVFFTFDPMLFTFVNLYFAISFYQSFLPKNSLFGRLRFVTMSHGWNFLISHRLHRFSQIKSA